jgi:hypothetical protein
MQKQSPKGTGTPYKIDLQSILKAAFSKKNVITFIPPVTYQ